MRRLKLGTRCGLEELEPRLLLSVAPEEQLFVYLLNRARHDPVAYQQENSLPIDLAYVTPRGPLAVNNSLYDSAEFHAVEMAANNYFAHQSTVTGQWPNQMARNAGYVLPASWPNEANYIESLAAGTFYSTPSVPLNALIVDEGIPSLGHRNHLLGIDSFNADNREIGVGHGFNASATYDNYWAIHATRTSASDRFLTGVAFNDANGNSRYDLNEGLANVTVAAGAFTTTTNAAGGWALEVPQGTYLVSAAGGSFVGTSTAVASVAGDNVEVDFLSGSPQAQVDFEVPPPPVFTLSISDATAAEGNSGTTNLVFTVTLTGVSSETVTVSFSTPAGTAVAGSDYQPAAGVLTFTPGTLARQITVQAIADLLMEGSESFTVNLSNPNGATLADGQGQGTITNDDATYARPNEILVVSPGPGRETTVRVLDQASGAERFRFTAFPSFAGGVQVATGDVNGDGVLDVIVAAGPGGGPHVRVFDGTTGNPLPGDIGNFYAYASAFSGGVMVAAADFNGDARAEIITAPIGNGGPHVRIFNSASGGILSEYFAYDGSFTGGVRVAAGDIDGNGTPDVITAPGVGLIPQVRVFSGASLAPISGPLASFLAYSAGFTGGVYVAAGDVNGDGRADIVTGAGAGGGPHVRVFNGQTGSELFGFFAYASAFTGGVRVATSQVNADGRADIITSPGMEGGPHVRVFDGATRAEMLGLFAYEGSFTGGLYVAGSQGESSLAGASSSGSPEQSALVSSEPAFLSDQDRLWGLLFEEPVPECKFRLGNFHVEVLFDLHDSVFADLGSHGK